MLAIVSSAKEVAIVTSVVSVTTSTGVDCSSTRIITFLRSTPILTPSSVNPWSTQGEVGVENAADPTVAEIEGSAVPDGAM